MEYCSDCSVPKPCGNLMVSGCLTMVQEMLDAHWPPERYGDAVLRKSFPTKALGNVDVIIKHLELVKLGQPHLDLFPATKCSPSLLQMFSIKPPKCLTIHDIQRISCSDCLLLLWFALCSRNAQHAGDGSGTWTCVGCCGAARIPPSA